jgi:PAS domain S-box-containing protein
MSAIPNPDNYSGLNARLDLDFALKAAKLGVWELDPVTRLVNWDDRCREFFAFRENLLPLGDVIERIHPDDREWVAEARRRAMSPDYPDEYDVTYRTIGADGKEICWVRFTGKAEYNSAGNLTRFAGIAQDVTQEVHAQSRLKSNELRFRSLIEKAPFAIAVYKTEDLIIDIANETMIKMWGKTDAVVGMRLADALPELEDQPFIELLSGVLSTGIPYQTDQQSVTLNVDGVLQTFWFKFTYQPLFDEQGKIYGILNMAVDITERVVTQKRVEETQEKILASFEQSPVAIAIINKELAFTMANSFYGELVGRKPDQLVGKPMLEALPELKGQGFEVLLQNVIDTSNAYVASEVPAKLFKNDGLETIYVNLNYQPFRDPDGTTSAVLVIAIDVTEQVNARKAAEARENQFRSIIKNAPAAIGLFVGRDLVIELPNQSFIDIVGKGSDIVGKPLREVMPELENQSFLQILDEVYSSGKMFQSFGSQVDILRQGVMTHNYYNITYSPLFDEAGEVYAILDIAIDVTDQVKSRQEIFEAQQQLAGAVELAELAMWRLDIKNQKFSFSPRFLDWLGFAETTQTVDATYETLPEEYRKSVADAVSRAIEPGSSGIYRNEHPIVNLITGQVRIIQTQAQVFYNADGEPELLSGSAQDVTRQRNTEASLEQLVQERTEELAATNEELAVTNEELAALNEEFAATNDDLAAANQLLSRSNSNLEQFAYIASHDLQEPLRKIRQFGDLLRAKYDSPSTEALVYLDRMQAAGVRMSALITDLLTFARITNHQIISDWVSLNDVVSATLTDLELRIQETDANVQVADLPAIKGDKVQLGQLFQNLLNNALKFRKPGTTPVITIRAQTVTYKDLPVAIKPAQAAAAYHLITVADNGIGFDQKYADRIFQAFQRLHGKSEFAGTGIGLAICEKVVVNHGGAISAFGDPGHGAVFNIYFPQTL